MPERPTVGTEGADTALDVDLPFRVHVGTDGGEPTAALPVDLGEAEEQFVKPLVRPLTIAQALALAHEKQSIKKAVDFLIGEKVLTDSPAEIASFLRTHHDKLDEVLIGDYLGERGEFEVAVLGHLFASTGGVTAFGSWPCSAGDSHANGTRRTIRARLTVRGCKDRAAASWESYAGTSTRRARARSSTRRALPTAA